MGLSKNYLSRKNLPLFSILAIATLATFAISNLRLVFWDFDLFPYVEPGKIAHYYINYYDFGFVKRGLIASVIATTGKFPGINAVSYLAFAIGVITCSLGSYFLYNMRGHFNNWSFLFFAAFVVFNSGTFMNLGYDLGRFDQLLIICCMLSFYFIREGALIKLIITSIIALLIHELYIILFFPILFYAIVFHSDFKPKQIGYLLLGIGVTLSALFFLGKIEGKSVEEIAHTISIDGFQFWDSGIIWKRTLEENIKYTGRIISGFSSAKMIPLFYGAAYTLLVFATLIMISVFNKMDWYGFIVILMTSLVIFFLAIDYSRWYSLIIINGFLFFGFCSFERREKSKVILTNKHIAVCSLLIIVGSALGPIGIIHSFPLFNFF